MNRLFEVDLFGNLKWGSRGKTLTLKEAFPGIKKRISTLEKMNHSGLVINGNFEVDEKSKKIYFLDSSSNDIRNNIDDLNGYLDFEVFVENRYHKGSFHPLIKIYEKSDNKNTYVNFKVKEN